MIHRFFFEPGWRLVNQQYSIDIICVDNFDIDVRYTGANQLCIVCRTFRVWMEITF